MSKSKVFIGSSKEGLGIAKALQVLLDHDFEVTIWSQGVFGLTYGTLEELVRQKYSFDFAILILTPDDLKVKRNQTKNTPRDNVLLELGIFIGSHGRERTFFVIDRDKEIDLPSDLAGITPVDYSIHTGGNLRSSLGAASTILSDTMKNIGPLKLPHTAKVQAFVSQGSPFKIIESFPSGNQKISTEEIKKIFIKFNNPVDKSTVLYIGNYYFRENTFCQWNICGWIEFAEKDTKLIWHVHEKNLSNDNRYCTDDTGYHIFEIHIGREPDEWRVKDIHGNELPKTDIKVYIK